MSRTWTVVAIAVSAVVAALGTALVTENRGLTSADAAVENARAPSNAQLERRLRGTDRRVIAALKRVNKATKDTARNKRSIAGIASTATTQGPQGVPGPPGPVGPATGPAGGALAGTYPNPGIADGAVAPDALAPVPAVSVGSANSNILEKDTPVSYDLTDAGGFDIGDMFDPASPFVVRAPRDGVYQVSASMDYQANSTASTRKILIRTTEPGGAPVATTVAQATAPAGIQSFSLTGSRLYSVPAGTTFELQGEAAEGGVASTGRMDIHYVGRRA